MLSALLKEESVYMSNTDQAATPAGGFGKMLNSLQGLQQRLEDFSIADVANAEANAQTLILRLKQIQGTIAALAQLKNAAADIRRSVAEIRPIDIEAINLDSLENHPQLNAIVKASKLIKLQKLMTALKAGADEGESIEAQARITVTEVSPTAALTTNHHSDFADIVETRLSEPEPAAMSDFVTEPVPASIAAEIDAASAPTTSPLPAVESAPESPTLEFAPSDRFLPETETVGTDFPTAQAEFETAAAEVVKTSSAEKIEGLVEDFPAPVETSTASLVAEKLPAVEPATKLAHSAKPKHGSKSAAKKSQKPRDNTAGQIEASKALVPANDSFDLRLLDDLVSNYGEFAANPNLPATVKKKELQNFAPAPSAAAELRPEPANSVETNTPSVRKDGDFDRQLKKIIKDYGEYDLYSDKPAANIKKAGILAFVFLGLVFGGIYFFTAPPSTAKTAPVSANRVNDAVQSDGTATGAKEANGAPRDARLGTAQNLEKPTAKK